jgi:hypothetical protein
MLYGSSSQREPPLRFDRWQRAQFGKLQGEGRHRRTSDWRMRELAVVRRTPADAPSMVNECDFVGSEVDRALDKGLFA